MRRTVLRFPVPLALRATDARDDMLRHDWAPLRERLADRSLGSKVGMWQYNPKALRYISGPKLCKPSNTIRKRLFVHTRLMVFRS